MLRRLGSHVRNQWIGVIALFVALATGTAYAANEWTGENIVNNTIGTADLQDENVRAVDIRDASRPGGGLTGAEIVSDSLTGADIATDAVGSSEIGTDAVGALEINFRGVGSQELSPYNMPEQSVSVNPGGGVNGVSAPCPAGTRLISGGAWFDFRSGDISFSAPDPDNLSAWRAEGQNNGNVAQDLHVSAFCLVAGFNAP